MSKILAGCRCHVWRYHNNFKECERCSIQERVPEPTSPREREDAEALWDDFANSRACDEAA